MKKSQLIELVKEAVTPPVAGDVKQLEKARKTTTTITNANKRINNPAELEQAFKGWITTLGIQSGTGTEQGKAKVSYSAVKTAVDRALRQLNWK